MSSKVQVRALVALALFPLASCGPETPPDRWGAVPRRVDLEVPTPRVTVSGGGIDTMAAQEARLALWPALDLVDSLTVDRLPTSTRAGMEWRSAPGLSDAVVWRFVLDNVRNAWSEPGRIGGPVKPAQLWRFALSVKPKMEPDSAFRVVLEGERETPEGDWRAELGTATVRVDWRAACAAVDRATCRVFPRLQGDALASVEARLALEHGRRVLDVEVHEVHTSERGEVHAYYSASGEETDEGAGSVETSTRYDFPGGPARAPTVSRSAWQASGAGRMDYSGPWTDSNGLSSVSHGEVCWTSTGEVVYRFCAMGGPHPPNETGSRSACAEGLQLAPRP